MTKEEIKQGCVDGILLNAGTISKEKLEDLELDVLSLALHLSMERLGWECVKCPHETFQWVGNELFEEEDGGLTILVKVAREPKENQEYDTRTSREEIK